MFSSLSLSLSVPFDVSICAVGAGALIIEITRRSWITFETRARAPASRPFRMMIHQVELELKPTLKPRPKPTPRSHWISGSVLTHSTAFGLAPVLTQLAARTCNDGRSLRATSRLARLDCEPDRLGGRGAQCNEWE